MGHFQTSQVTLSTTPKQLDSPTNRVALQVLNTDSTIIVYLGTNNKVNAQVGFPLTGGAGYKFTNAAGSQVWAVAASGTPVVAIIEEYAL